jgi:hypothetical protein
LIQVTGGPGRPTTGAASDRSAKPQIEVSEGERRANPRFSCDLEAAVDVDGESSEHRVVDVGRGGISLVGEEPIAIGTHITIRLRAIVEDEPQEPFDVPGTVVWCSKTKDDTFQVGAKFDDSMGRQRERKLEALLAQLRGED